MSMFSTFSTNLTYVVDIERMYGKRKPIAVRKPLFLLDLTNMARGQKENGPAENDASEDSAHEAPTPAATEGETASDSELDIEIETEFVATPKGKPRSDSTSTRSRPQVSEHNLYQIFQTRHCHPSKHQSLQVCSQPL